MWFWIGIAFAVLAAFILILVLVVAARPSDFRIARSASFSAAPDRLFGEVNDLHKWEAWSPWAKRDLAMKQDYGGPPAGTGATYHWDGNKDVGEGRMTITESVPSSLIRIKLEFMRPFAAINTSEFILKPEGGGTHLTWAMTGKHNFVVKFFTLFMDMDKMVGGDFEKGLASLKAIVEK